MGNKPKWEHDCEDCKFLGNFNGGLHQYDLYWCSGPNNMNGTSVIGRFGSNGPEYSSLLVPEAFASPLEFIEMVNSRKDYYYKEALVRATEQGLYKGKYAECFKR